MPKPNHKPQVVAENYHPSRDHMGAHSWAGSHGLYITGRAYIDGADETAAEMETKWGCDRLRLLVDPETRDKFDRQRYLFNQAIWHGDLEAVRRESSRMVKAWLALDRMATAAGKAVLAPEMWEVALEGGPVAVIVRDDVQAHAAVAAEGRHVAIYTLEEIGRLLSAYPDIARVKEVFPGATVAAIKKSISDPLEGIRDTKEGLDDQIPF